MRRALHAEQGQSLVELLVAIVLMVGALGAITGIFSTFVNANADAVHLTAAEDSARTELDVMTRMLRNARSVGSLPGPVLVSQPNDVVVGTADWPGTAGANGASVVRYCVDTATKTLWFDGLQTLAAGPSNPGASCPSAAAGWTHHPIVSGVVANGTGTGTQLFTYTTNAVGAVTGVDISLRLDGGRGGRARVSALRTSATIRSLTGQKPAVSASDVRVTCNADHSALLSLAVTTDHDGNPLDAVFRTADGLQIGTGSSVGVAARLQGALTVTVTNVLGLQTILTKNVSC